MLPGGIAEGHAYANRLVERACHTEQRRSIHGRGSKCLPLSRRLNTPGEGCPLGESNITLVNSANPFSFCITPGMAPVPRDEYSSGAPAGSTAQPVSCIT